MRYLYLISVCLLLTACGVLSPEQQQTALQTIDAMMYQGTITPSQADALRETIMQAGQQNFWNQAAQVGLGAVMGYLGVQAAPGRAASVAARKAAVAVQNGAKA